jgi:glycosyltransferase involved in cell wall biosynthesis
MHNKTDIEYILIDDASKDDTLHIALSQSILYGRNNFNIIINESNIGLSNSSNVAIENAKGKYIMRVDADDKLNYHNLPNMLKEIKDNDYALLYPDYEIIEDGSTVRSIEKGNTHHHAGGCLMNKKVINELRFKENLRHWDSLELYSRVKEHPELKIGYTDSIGFLYRIHDKNMSRNNLEERNKVLETITKRGD